MGSTLNPPDTPTLQTGPFRPQEGVTTWLRGLLKLNAAAALLGAVLVITIGAVASEASISGIVRVSDTISALQVVIYLATAIFFAVWSLGIHRNIHTIAGRRSDMTPTWAAVGYFVPFANLVHGYRVVKEAWQSGAPVMVTEDPDDWKKTPAPAVFSWWWGLFLTANFAARASSSMAGPEPSSGSALGVAGMVLFAELCLAGAAMLADGIVQQVADRQAERFEQVRSMDEADLYFDLGEGGDLAVVRSQERSIENYEWLVEVHPRDVEARMNLGIAYYNADRYQEALDELLEAKDINPHNVEVRTHLAAVYIALERYSAAEAACRQALDEEPDSVPALCLLAEAAIGDGRPRDAVEPSRRAIELEHGNAEARLNLGHASALLADRAAAMEELRVLREIDPVTAEELRRLIERDLPVQ